MKTLEVVMRNIEKSQRCFGGFWNTLASHGKGLERWRNGAQAHYAHQCFLQNFSAY